MDSNFECKSRKPVLLFSVWPDLGLCHDPRKKTLKMALNEVFRILLFWISLPNHPKYKTIFPLNVLLRLRKVSDFEVVIFGFQPTLFWV